MIFRRALASGLVAGVLGLSGNALAEESKEPVKESNFKWVPLLTSTPVAGVGAGAAFSYLYDLDDTSSRSQLRVGGQYTTAGSITMFVENGAFFDENNIVSTTKFLPGKTVTSFDDERIGAEVEYKMKSILFMERLVHRIGGDLAPGVKFYGGGKLVYRNNEFTPENTAGRVFLVTNGIRDEKSVGLGAALTLDSRKNKYYPREAYWVDLDYDMYTEWLGSDKPFEKLTFNARYYAAGLGPRDVLAMQLYGEYASDDAPDSGLPTISGKTLLRGYPAGQFRAKYLTGSQIEYRYQIPETRFRLIAFGGIARLNGGSDGILGKRRDDDWYNAFGVGARYTIQPKTGVDVRLDFVRTSIDEYSMYLLLNQAF